MKTGNHRLRRIAVGSVVAIAVAAGGATVAAVAANPSTTAATTTPVKGDVVTLINKNTTYCADVQGSSTAKGAVVVSATCDSSDAFQQWTVDTSGTELGFVNKGSGLCLAVTDSTAGSSLVTTTCARTQAQFYAIKPSTTYFLIDNDQSELCLTDTGSKTLAPGKALSQQTCSTTASTDNWSFGTVSGSTPVTTTTTSAASSSTGLSTGDIWVSTSGSDSAAGTKAAPYATIAKALSSVKAGQTIVLRGGTYKPTATLKPATSGTSSQRIIIGSYTGENAVIDGSKISSDSWTWNQTASYMTVQDLEVKNALNHPVVCTSCAGVIYQRLRVHDNQETGIALRGDGTTNNKILDNDLYLNHDDATKGQNADGIAIKFGTGTGNVVKGNRMYNNADDGIDLWHFLSPVTIQDNWAYGNGVNRWNISGWEGNGNGFKLGGDNLSANHIVKNNAAWDNNANGFTENSNTGSLTLTRNTAYDNAAAGFYFKISTSTLTGNVSVANATTATIGTGVKVSSNSWQSGTWSASSFKSVSATTAVGSRDADGTLPTVTFLVPSSSTTQGSTMTES
ncbi:RICIN domain-containing protein [Kineosporia sp. NBRC 101731]|uniref:RICIN domain-containing protein n=1 Tax=Kineosporia sp. NBRC 101731 TaxID=3032199 RepID=UPI0024A4F898|nr:RICIN domain-containing protein [Kineosporia sp. NBRC 101731]GLY28664.1 hypothetical protein Kisp02_20290 [Kineosporia sp. NBRC 101731]